MPAKRIPEQDNILKPFVFNKALQVLGKVLDIGFDQRHIVYGQFRHQDFITLLREIVGHPLKIAQPTHQSVKDDHGGALTFLYIPVLSVFNDLLFHTDITAYQLANIGIST